MESDLQRTPISNQQTDWLGRVGTRTGLYVPGSVGGCPLHFLYDTGATVTCLGTRIWAEIPEDKKSILEAPDRKLTSVGGEALPVWGIATMEVEIDGHPITCQLQVVEIAEDAVLGLDLLSTHQLQWDWMRGELVWPTSRSSANIQSPRKDKDQEQTESTSGLDPEMGRGKDGAETVRDPESSLPEMEVWEELPNRHGRCLIGWDRSEAAEEGFPECTVEEVRAMLAVDPGIEQIPEGYAPGVPAHLRSLYEASLNNLGRRERAQLAEMLEVHGHIFSRDDQDIGCTSLELHHIPTGEATPIRLPPRRAPMHLREDVEKQVQTMLEQGIVEECSSPWAAPLVIVKKKDGSNRICVDYRALNAVTQKDGHPLPRIEDSLDALAGAVIYSTLDMTSGYHQVEVAKEDRDKTAFVTGHGHHLRYVTMPFGLCNAPSTFQRLMERVLHGLIWKCVVVYLDDVVIYSSSIKEHMSHLQEVFKRFEAHNLKLKPRKCELFRTEVRYLGHVVSPAGIATDPRLIEKVTSWEPPRNVRGVRAFLGLTGYYRTYIPNYGDIAEPLVRLTDARTQFHWNSECQLAFEDLKHQLINAPILAFPNQHDTFILDTDASNVAIGAVLSQCQGDQEKVIAYGSHALSKEERNYCVTRRELLAIVHFVEAYKYYLYGKPFIVRTDHSSLRWMLNQKEPTDQLARWIQRLSTYQFTIEHRPGKKHGNADAMSRRDGKCFRGGVCFHPSHPEDSIPDGTRLSLEQPNRQYKDKGITPEEGVGALREKDLDESDQEISPEPNIGLTIGLSREELLKLQKADSDLQYLQRRLEAGLPRPNKEEVSPFSSVIKYWCGRWDQLALNEGLLYYKWEPDQAGDPVSWKLITPHALRETVMKAVHDLKAAGHLGISRTWEKAQRSPFIWVGMRGDVERWVRACQLCQQKKPPSHKKRAKLVSYQSGVPFERIAADVAGPFPATDSGNRFILVVQDYFTKWVEAFPMADQTAETIATILVDNIFARFGCPREFHSDQGTNFESQVMREVHRLFGIQKTRTTAYHPRGDGMVERHNRTVEGMLALWTNEYQNDWDKHLSLLGMAYRSAPHETTSETPNMLNLGREVTLPVDLLLEAPPSEPQDEASFGQYAINLQERMRTAQEIARAKMTKQMVAQKRHYDANVRLVPYKEGDIVWLHNPARKRGRSAKLSRPWTGPYLIVQKINDVNFRIQASPRSRQQVVHADRLKTCVGRVAQDLGFKVTENEHTREEEASTSASGCNRTAETSPVPSQDQGDSPDSSNLTDSEEEDEQRDSPPVVTTRIGRRIRRPRRYNDYYL